MKLGILTAIWKRPELTGIMLPYWSQMRVSGVELDPVAIVSPEDDMFIVPPTRYGWDYEYAPNHPLSDKWNAGMQAMRARGVDAVMIVGSDNFITPTYLAYVRALLQEGYDFLRLRDCWFYEAGSENLYHASPALPGAGRVLAASLLDRMDWQPWEPGKSRYLDMSMQHRMEQPAEPTRQPNRPHDVPCFENHIVCLDVKTDTNLWQWDEAHERLIAPEGRELRFANVTRYDALPVLLRFFPSVASDLYEWSRKPNERAA